MNHRLYHPWTLLLLLGFLACKEPAPAEPSELIDWGQGTFVVNEGNFTWGNATLDYIDREGTRHPDLFGKYLEGALGDVGQSILIRGNRAYVVVNNSGRIEVVSFAKGLEHTCTISGLGSPRHMAFASAGKAYVTDLYDNALAIVDPENCAVTGRIPVGSWTEDLLLVGGELWVCEMGADRLLVIDVTTDQVIDSVQVGREPNSMVHDAQGRLWVLCSGGLSETLPSLHRIHPGTRQVEQSLTFPEISDSPGDLALGKDGISLYYLNGDVYRMSTADNVLAGQPWVPANGANYYGLEVHPETGDVWLMDAVDYVQAGRVLQLHPSSGNVVASWPGGIIPGAVGFVY